MKWLVFSKDRPYQLDAFIRTAEQNAKILKSDISVLYRYTEGFENDIETLKFEHPEVEFINQKNFREDVLSWLERPDSNIVSFATDDALFTREVPVKTIEDVLLSNQSVTTFTLRMGLHLEHCYPTNSPQKIPDGMISNGIFVWSATGADGDWGYPLSVDGHVFKRELVKGMYRSFDFKDPNSLESNWQNIRHQISPVVCCLPKSCYFNVPLNRVQETHKNRCGDVDTAKLQTIYRCGLRVKPRFFTCFVNISAHQEVKIA
jgi:hypothetical protein